MKGFFGKLQKLGRALMLPVAVLPIAGLLLRLGADDVLNIPFISSAGDAILGNLPIIFAIGVAVGFAFDNSGAAGLAGAVGYFVLTAGAAVINDTINMGVLGGIIAGVVAGNLYNKYHDIKLPEWLGFFWRKEICSYCYRFCLYHISTYIWICLATCSKWYRCSSQLDDRSRGFRGIYVWFLKQTPYPSWITSCY